jgi:hypothetical protein
MNLGNNTYKIHKNLHICKNYVISYETKVAKIERDQIISFGKYSRTTSKHILLIGQIFGLPITIENPHTTVSSLRFQPKNTSFHKFEIGSVDINFEKSISPRASKIIIEKLKNNNNYKVVIASLCGKIAKKDWELLDKRGIKSELIKGSRILSRNEIM